MDLQSINAEHLQAARDRVAAMRSAGASDDEILATALALAEFRGTDLVTGASMVEFAKFMGERFRTQQKALEACADALKALLALRKRK
jgi:hypothetical protein